MKKLSISALTFVFMITLVSPQAVASIKLTKFEVSFQAGFIPDNLNHTVLIAWNTAKEINTQGFNIWRSEEEDGDYIKINSDLIEPSGGEILGAEYTYTDEKAPYGAKYILEEIGAGGQSIFYDMETFLPSESVADEGESPEGEPPDGEPPDGEPPDGESETESPSPSPADEQNLESQPNENEDLSLGIKLPSSQGCFLSTVGAAGILAGCIPW